MSGRQGKMIRRFREIIYFIVFVLLQTLVIDNIHLFGIVTPFLYIYVIIKFKVGLTRSSMILLSFLLGLIIDIFSDTYGVHAAACSITGFICKPLFERIVDTKDLPNGSFPSYEQIGYRNFFNYTLIVVTIHHVVLFSIESFGFHQPLLLITRLITSILMTSLLVFLVEAFNLIKIKNGK